MRAAELRMAQDDSDVAGRLAAVSGDDRAVGEYLVAEGLDTLEVDEQEVLLQTSICDRFRAELCDAVTARGDAAGRLARIQQANLFFVPLGRERTW